VVLPDYVEALNATFRYQLTSIGGSAPNLHVAEEITNNRFKIAGGVPGKEVHWQVTGVRKDEWAQDEEVRLRVEEEKPAVERPFFLHPQAHGEPEERGIEHARRRERARQAEELKQGLEEHTRLLEALRDKIGRRGT
jgi:hypothetical protein